MILDELNLAPTDVLEALNRLLDDNRELFIPETQETVKAHSMFMLFATQNPPGSYGGRKVLSRAFRNRFVEIHFDEIASAELEVILHKKCSLPASYCKKLVGVMLELQRRRCCTGVFSGKQGFMTLRDLFRWAERYRRAEGEDSLNYDWEQHLADHGYLLLAGRVRKPADEVTILDVLHKFFKRKVDPDERLFTLSDQTSPISKLILETVQRAGANEEFKHIVWTFNLRFG